jgi:GTP-binding protein
MNEKPIRNVAIIAHVDHGKTTLVDEMIKQSGSLRKNQVVGERMLDANPLERERGITILAKNISVHYKDVKINIMDTPGHADFGGEVERVMKMADGVLLLVDAFEGTMPQTRFVLRKAFECGHRAIVVLNKVDRPDSRPKAVLEKVFDLFVELGASDEQLDFPVLYTSAKDGYSRYDLHDTNMDIVPLFDTILRHIHPPTGDPEKILQMLVTTLDYSDYVGRIAIGRIFNGRMRTGMPALLSRRDGSSVKGTITGLYAFEGLKREKIDTAEAGEIVAVEGLTQVEIGDTITDPETPAPLPRISVDEPTLSMIFRVNDSPYCGSEGTYVTSRHVRDRLMKELNSNVALRVEETEEPDALNVSGRGTLHLGVLIENMRREGYEFAVGKPKVILHEEDGETLEPIEQVMVDVAEPSAGKVIELLGKRRGEMVSMVKHGGRVHLEFGVPARGLIGIRNRILNLCGGEVIFHHNFLKYDVFRGPIPGRGSGVMVAMEMGDAVTYSLNNLQDRGQFFVGPGMKVYEGMIVGEYNKEGDIAVNVCKGRKLTNMRSAGADKAIKLPPAHLFSVEEALEYIEDDELVEFTPKSIRLRKINLKEKDRRREQRAAAAAEEA